MKVIITALVLTILACSSTEKTRQTTNERFIKSLVNIETAASVTRLTDDGRAVYPLFAPGDSIVFYKRLLITEPTDTFTYKASELVKSYGLNVNNGDLYTLTGDYSFPPMVSAEQSTLPKRYNEATVWGLISPDSAVTAFETVTQYGKEVHLIYLATKDSVEQITYGDVSCFLDKFSNTGRYISIVYGKGPTWILVYDLKKRVLYRIEREGELVDYMTSFSSDDKMMLFLRTERKYMYGGDYFGDVWLVKFKD